MAWMPATNSFGNGDARSTIVAPLLLYTPACIYVRGSGCCLIPVSVSPALMPLDTGDRSKK